MIRSKNQDVLREVGSSKTGQSAVVRHPAKSVDYTSEGVVDHDVLLLPGSDYQYMIGLTVVGAIIRLFRIYQPSSVVFDEVQ